MGLVTTPIPRIRLAPESYSTFVCGPPVIYMKCGVGKCGHCLLGGKYICMEGPVFKYSQMKDLGFG